MNTIQRPLAAQLIAQGLGYLGEMHPVEFDNEVLFRYDYMQYKQLVENYKVDGPRLVAVSTWVTAEESGRERGYTVRARLGYRYNQYSRTWALSNVEELLALRLPDFYQVDAIAEARARGRLGDVHVANWARELAIPLMPPLVPVTRREVLSPDALLEPFYRQTVLFTRDLYSLDGWRLEKILPY